MALEAKSREYRQGEFVYRETEEAFQARMERVRELKDQAKATAEAGLSYLAAAQRAALSANSPRIPI